MSQFLPLAEQLKNLEQLQELDLRIDSIKKEQDSLPLSLKVIDEAVQKLQGQITAKKAQIADIEKMRRQAQAALDINRDRLERSNAKLEAVHKAQEFQAANKEIDQLKKLGQSLEDQNQKSLNEEKSIDTDLQSLIDQLAKLNAERQSQITAVSGKTNEFQTNLSTLMEDRTQYTKHVERRILSQYDRVRAARGGLGIVPALGGRCKGCNMVVPPQLFNEIQRGTVLHACPSCHRILYVHPIAGQAESPEASHLS